MDPLETETTYVEEEIDTKSYRDRISDLESQLHDLRDKLSDEEVNILQDRGYKPINIDEFKIMVPVGMTIEQLRVSLEQMPPPENSDRAIKYLVSDEDKSAVHEADSYKEIVSQREDLIESVKEVYTDFWNEEIQSIADTDEEAIAYMMAGLQKDIRSRKLSDITGISKRICRNYTYKDGIVHRKNSS